ncbi:Nicotinate catabolism cluster-specific transcription factor [Colletotrichum viniferum]|nr:Nicotinate catabolism cluster-specific transcription factor [Colletotrichum viniferum]
MRSRASAVANKGDNTDNDGAADDVGDGNGPPSSPSSSTASASLPCPECGQTFRRREHLSRHLDRHSGRRAHACSICKRAFSRSSGDDDTILVAQPATDGEALAALSTPRQQLPPIASQSYVSDQPSLEPDLLWDALLTPAQFLFPFSPVPSLGAGTSTNLCFGDTALAAVGDSADDQSAQNSFGAVTTPRTEIVEVFTGPDNLTAEEEDILIAEYVPHVPPITVETRAYMIQAIKARLPQHEAQGLDANFPSLRHLDTYMQLYFEHFHPRMPLLHVPTFQASPETWQLVLSVVCLGSRYSLAHHHEDHVLLLQRIAQHMLKRDIRKLSSNDVLIYAQSLLLFHRSQWLSGQWNIVMGVQFHRNILATLCRQLLSREGTLMHTHTSADNANHAWSQWIQAEGKRRVIHFTWMWECLQATFFMLPPLLSVAELQTPVPTSDAHWSSTYDQWHLHPPPQPSSTLCALIARVGLGDVVPASLEQPAKSAILLSAVVQQAAESDLLRAMGLGSVGSPASQPGLALGMGTMLSQKAFDALSQVLQFFRTARVATILDILSILICVLYMVAYVDIVEQRDPSAAGSGGVSVGTSCTEIIRLDQVVDVDLLNDWLEVRNHKKPHVTGVGLLHSGRSVSRLYKEGSRIMASGSSVSRMAKEMSTIFESQAKGYPPNPQDHRQDEQNVV